VPKKKKNKTLKVMLGIAALVAVPVVGTTLAASIGINVNGNSNTPIQFGQGVVQATACDSAITVTADSTFVNTAYDPATPGSGGSYYLGDVTISEILSACNSKKFQINVFTNSAGAVGECEIENYNGLDSTAPAAVTDASNTVCTSGTADVTYYSTVPTSNDGEIVVNFGSATPLIDAAEVYKVTVETS
jgi:hypothetical protein